jgi:TatD DNase family protein
MLIDTHTHITMSDFDTDRDDVIKRFLKKDVRKIIEVGFDLESSQKSVNFAEEDDNEMIFAAVGVHPHNADKMHGNWLEELADLASSDKVVAIGEIGLDFYRDLSSRDAQKKIFREQIKLAEELDLSMIIHCRDAYPDALKILKEEEAVNLVMHCFAGDYYIAMECVQRGYFLGIGGTITFNNSNQRPFIEKIPLDCILVETDCPYLTPMPHRGKRNEPAYVTLVAEELADAYELNLGEIAEITTDNAEELFGI